MKFVDRQGRVDKFKKKMETAKKLYEKKQKEIEKKLAKQTQQDQTEEKSYQDILRDKQAQLRKADTKSTASTKKTEPDKKDSK